MTFDLKEEARRLARTAFYSSTKAASTVADEDFVANNIFTSLQRVREEANHNIESAALIAESIGECTLARPLVYKIGMPMIHMMPCMKCEAIKKIRALKTPKEEK